MQPRVFLVDFPLFACLTLSAAIHAALLYLPDTHAPVQPRFEAGRTVMKLTLAPSAASRASSSEAAAAEPEPVPAPQPVVQSRPEPMSNKQSAEAVEQDASLNEDKGVITAASAESSIRPVYPRISRLRGEEGEVTLAIEVPASGRAGKIDVVQSSGYRRLDEAAISAVRSVSFIPAAQFGRAVDSDIELSFTFRLTDD
jgi:protein TonB